MIHKIPVLLLNYNRPAFSARVLKNLEKIKPEKIYVSIDGNKNDSDDRKKVDAVESLYKSINWQCEYKIKRNPVNLGLRGAVTSALNWFFAENEFGVVLEDDVEFDENFFKYCYRFSKYESNHMVGALSGNNLLAHMFTKEVFQPKYLLARVFHCWGWATWRSRWLNYDDNIENDDYFFDKVMPEYLNHDLPLINFWNGIRAALRENVFDTWAFRYILSSWRHDLYFLTPPSNLTTNYGFVADSTHTSATPFYIPSMTIGEFQEFSDEEYEILPSPAFEKFEEKFLLGIDRSPLLL
jgi:GT2 family glycosyltransferase